MSEETWKHVKDALEAGSYLATLLGIPLALLGYWFAREAQKAATASEHYQGYLSQAVERPRLAAGGVPKGDPDFERYQWFVSVMLHASEEILVVTSNDLAWRNAVCLQLKYHGDYLASPEFVEERAVYDRRLACLINEVVVERRAKRV